MQKLSFLVLIFTVLIACKNEHNSVSNTSIRISVDPSISQENLQGRLLLMFSNNDEKEPRFQINDGLQTQLIFGMNVENLNSSKSQLFDQEAFGYPISNLKDIKPGTYYVQALLHVYEDFKLSSGHIVKLPMDNGEGQKWNLSPGNFYSTPMKIEISNEGIKELQIVMTKKIEPLEEPKDTEWIKHVKMKSEKLSSFWGRDIFLGAHVLLPKGFEEHPEAKYPIMIFHGHFPEDFGGFRTTPPDPDLEPDFAERFNVKGYNIIQQQEAYDFYKRWNEPDFPRFIIIEIQHPTPYYDDSYAVNSASQGPYGDAITYELIPFIEQKFRGMGEGWARFLYGGSTGGWEALAVQVMYPDEYNGCFAACPDPIDFSAYCLNNIYEDKNAYYYESDFNSLEIPAKRDYLGQISSTVKRANQFELVLGDHSRSGQQWDIWEATYSPQGEDGYPQRIWDKMTWRDQSYCGQLLERKLRFTLYPGAGLGQIG